MSSYIDVAVVGVVDDHHHDNDTGNNGTTVGVGCCGRSIEDSNEFLKCDNNHMDDWMLLQSIVVTTTSF